MGNSSLSNTELTNSETKARKVELSRQAQLLRDKLNIPLIECHEKLVNVASNQIEEEKGEQLREEFDQSRPLTTRIYDKDDDQDLFIQYKNFKPSEQNKHMSCEAGRERISKDEIAKDESDNLGDEQYSMIIKNIDDSDEEPDFPFSSSLGTPTQGFRPDETKEEDLMTVIENDWENEYNDIFKSLKDFERQTVKIQKKEV